MRCAETASTTSTGRLKTSEKAHAANPEEHQELRKRTDSGLETQNAMPGRRASPHAKGTHTGREG